MGDTLERMTLQDLLKEYGITTIRELTHRTGLSRQQSWNLWHAHAGVGKETLRRLHERLGIPLERLLEVDPVPRRKPEGGTAKPSSAPKRQASQRKRGSRRKGKGDQA
jgi:transcriptional regulator with XRE-family HTH domain